MLIFESYLKSNRPGQPVTTLVCRLPNGDIVRRKQLSVRLANTDIAQITLRFATDCLSHFQPRYQSIVSRCESVLL